MPSTQSQSFEGATGIYSTNGGAQDVDEDVPDTDVEWEDGVGDAAGGNGDGNKQMGGT